MIQSRWPGFDDMPLVKSRAGQWQPVTPEQWTAILRDGETPKS